MTLLCLAALWLAGFGLLRWLFPQPRGWSLHNIWLFSLAFGAGGGIASCLYFVVLLIAGASTAVLASCIAVFVAVGLILGWSAKHPAPRLDFAAGPAIPRYLKLLFFAAAALALLMFLGAVLYNPHGEEGAWSIFNLRARFLFRAGALWHIAFSTDLNWSHLDYPLLIPGLVALCWKLAGADSIAAPVAIAFLFGLGTVGVLMSTLAALRGRIVALLAGMLLLGTASFVALVASLYGDVPLGFYILSTVVLLCLQDRDPNLLRYSVLAGLMAGLGAWTRNEGLVFAAAVFAARAVALFRSRERSSVLAQLGSMIAGMAAPLAVVAVFKFHVAPPSTLLSVSSSVVIKNAADVGRWIIMLEGLIVAFFNFGRFLIPIILLLGVYWYLIRFRPDPQDRPALTTALIALPITLAVQLVMDVLYEPNLALEIGTSFERILLQLWPAALFVFFLASAPPQLAATERARKTKVAAKAAKPKAPKSGRSIAQSR